MSVLMFGVAALIFVVAGLAFASDAFGEGIGAVAVGVVALLVAVAESNDRASAEAVAVERCVVAGGWWSEQGVTLPDGTVHCLASPPVGLAVPETEP